MKVNRHQWETSAVRVLCAVAVLSAAGYLVLGSGLRSQSSGPRAIAQIPEAPLQSGLANLQPVSERSSSSSSSSFRGSKSRTLAAFNRLPLMFEPNVGQTDPSVKFVARGAGYSLFLTNEGAVMTLRAGHDSGSETIGMKFAGANPSPALSGDDPLPGKSNYFMGNDPSRWHSNVPQFGRVRYENVYPGINLLFYGNQGHLEYDFRIAPGADASRAQL